MSKHKSAASIQFIRGMNETTIPKIRIKRNNDGKRGKALFHFKKEASLSEEETSTYKAMVMIDKEGELISKQISVKAQNSKEVYIEAIYHWKNEIEFKRFMRFAKEYAGTYAEERNNPIEQN